MDKSPISPSEDGKKRQIANADVFRTNLEHLMRLKGWNKSELAKRSGVGPDMLYKFFQGRSNSFDAMEAKKLAQCLNTSVDILLGTHEENVLKTIALIEKLEPKEREIVLRQIEGLLGHRD